MDTFIGFLVGVGTLWFMYRQNEILKEQNAIMRRTSKSKAVPSSPWLKLHWPMAAMLGLAVVTWLPHFIPSLPQDFQSKERSPMTVSISSESSGSVSLEEISDKTFEDADVPLDGHFFKNCTFINICLLYSGGEYRLENATFKKQWHVCVKNADLTNYASLLAALKIPTLHLKDRQIVTQHPNVSTLLDRKELPPRGSL